MKKPFLTSSAEFTGDVSIGGDLTISGTTTTIDTVNLEIQDKNIILAKSGTPTNLGADGGGITLQAATNKTITWDSTNDAWGVNCNFEVSGDINFTGNLNQNGVAFSSGDPAIWAGDGASDISYSNGSVGIGTASPSTDLEVQQSSAAPAINIIGQSANQIDRATIGFNYGAGTGFIAGSGYSSQSKDFYIYSVYASQTRLLIDSDGNIGIGDFGTANDSVNSKLVIRDSFFTGLSDGTGGFLDENGDAITSSELATLRTSKNNVLTLIALSNGYSPYNGFGGGIVFNNSTYTNQTVYSSAAIYGGIGDNSAYTDIGGHLAFCTSNARTDNPTEKMRITSAGNVGISATNPQAKLSVGTSSIPTENLTSAIFLYGTEVVSTGDAWISLKSTEPTDGTNWTIANNTSVASGVKKAGYLSIGHAAQVLSLTQDNNVGIGISDPHFKLSVLAGSDGVSPVAACFSVNDAGLGDQQEVSIGFGQQDYTFSKIAGYYDTAGTGMGLKMYVGDDLSVDPQTGLARTDRDRTDSSPSLTIKPNGNLEVFKTEIKQSSGAAGSVYEHIILSRGGSLAASISTKRDALTNDADAIYFNLKDSLPGYTPTTSDSFRVECRNVGLSTFSCFAQTRSSESTVIGNNIYVKPDDPASNRIYNKNSHGTYGHSFIEMLNGEIRFCNKTEASVAGVLVDRNRTMTIYGDGNVGIGTTIPSTNLEVQQSSGNPAINIIGDTGNQIDRATIGFEYGTGTGFVAGSGLGSQTKDFYIHSVYAGATRFYIDDAGSVAITTDVGKPPLKINYGDGSFYKHLGVVSQDAGGTPGNGTNTGPGAYQHVRIRDVWNSQAMFSIRVRGYLPYSVLMDNSVGMYRYALATSANRATPLNHTYLNQGSGPNPQTNTFPGAGGTNPNGFIHSIYNTSADPGYLVVVVVWAMPYKGFSVECYSEGPNYGNNVNPNIEIIDVKRSTSAAPLTTWT